GDSAGAHLSALVALGGEEPSFSSEYRADPHASVSAKVKAVVGFYGVYDMLAQWGHDLLARPRDNISEKILGVAPHTTRRIFFEASPISYATVDRNLTRFLLIHGDHDDIVDPSTQSMPFLAALKQAGFFVRTVVIPGAGHFFVTDPVDDTSFNGFARPKVVRFLKDVLELTCRGCADQRERAGSGTPRWRQNRRVDLTLEQFQTSVGPAIFNQQVSAFDQAFAASPFRKALTKCGFEGPMLLTTRGAACCARATSSARARRVGGTVRPSAFAGFKRVKFGGLNHRKISRF